MKKPVDPYRFDSEQEELQFCVLERPHGTVLLVTVDFFPRTTFQGSHFRSHHIELEGGLCTSDTGYHSHFSMALNRCETEQELVEFALRLAEDHFKELHPKGQFDLFEQQTN